MAERNFKLVVEYNGTPFGGWQSQLRGDSIQEAFEAALTQMLGHKPTLRVAGRTDAGVHALAQVVSFKTESAIPERRIIGGLNALLPEAISVHSIEEMPLDFDAKRSSMWKRYRYSIYQAPQQAALLRNSTWHWTQRLDLEAMREAATHLVGELNFDSFRAVKCQAEHAWRTMYGISIERHERLPAGELLHITFHANAFVRHMCRILAGTLVEVGRGNRSAASIAGVVAARDRTKAGMTAPSHGLCLLEVSYTPMPGDQPRWHVASDDARAVAGSEEEA